MQLQILLPVRLEFFIVLFYLPFTITIFCYVNLVHILVALPNITARRKQGAMGQALVTLFNFIVCFAPYNLSHVVGFVQNESSFWRVYALLLSTLNAALDPCTSPPLPSNGPSPSAVAQTERHLGPVPSPLLDLLWGRGQRGEVASGMEAELTT
ncbi:unnamed protein product [Eretmochelys imbricata]